MEFTDVLKQIIESYGGVGIFIVFLLIICIVSIPVGLPIFLNKKSLHKLIKQINKDSKLANLREYVNELPNTILDNSELDLVEIV